MSHDSGAVQVLPSRTGGSPAARAADQHFRSAEDALRHGEYERAAAEFTYCIQLAPARTEAFSKRGDIWRILGRLEAAISDYTAALQLSSHNAAVLLNRGQLHALAGRHQSAIEDFTAALEMDPSNGAAFLSRGQSLNRLGQTVPALADFTRAIDYAPGNAFAFVERGTAFLAHGDPAAAIADLRRAIQLNPFLWLALARRADAHLALGLPEQAASDLTEALRLDPQNPELLAARGSVQLKLGKLDAALHDCTEAVALSPHDPGLRAERARVYRALEKFDEADHDLTEALRLKPGDCSLHYDRAEVRLDAKMFDPAFADFVEVSKRSPQNGLAYRGQALVYLSRDDHAMAVSCLDRCLEVAPTCADGHYQRARCKLRLEQLDESLADATKALEIEPDNVPARRLRADVSLRLGRTDEAFADVAQLVNLAPEDAIVYHLRGKIEFRRGRLEAAIQDLSVALKLSPNFTEALADRAGVYRGLGKHREALFDLTAAVQQDPKYSAEYLVQRGIVHGATGELNRATADFLVALQLDPNNKAAVRGKELVAQLRDSRGPSLSESAEFDLSRQEEAERVIGGAKRGRSWRSLIEPDEFAEVRAKQRQRRALAPSREAEIDLVAGQDAGFEIEGGFEDNLDATTASDFELEALDQAPAARGPRPQRSKTATTVEDRADQTIDELLKEDDAPQPFSTPTPARTLQAAAPMPPVPPPPAPAMPSGALPAVSAATVPAPAKPAALTKRKKKEDPEERALRMRKYRRYAIIAVGACFLLYWGVGFAWDLIPRSENPFTEYTAEDVVQRYSKDASEADDKFAGKRIAVRGKVKLHTAKGDKHFGKIFFEVAGAKDEVRIELQFAGEEPPLMTDGQEYRINGKVTRYKPASGIQIKECNLMPVTSQSRGRGELSRDFAGAGEGPSRFHAIRSRRSHRPHIARLQETSRDARIGTGRPQDWSDRVSEGDTDLS